MSSVAPDSSIFPPAKAMAPGRGNAVPDRSDNGEFAKLLDDEPARETAPPAKRNESKSQRRDDTTPTDKAPQSDDTAKAKSSKSEIAAEQAATESANVDASKSDTTKAASTGDKTADEATETQAANAVETVLFNVPVIDAQAAVVMIAAVGAAPAEPIPANGLPETDPAIVPTSPQGDVAPAGATPAAAVPTAIATPQSGAADAAAGDMPAAVAPVVPGAVKAQQQVAAAETPGTNTPVAAQAKPGATKPDGTEQNQAAARAEPEVELPAGPAPQRTATPGEPATATTRPQDSAAVAKTGAELAQSLGFTAPAQHAAPAQSTAAAHAAAAGAPTPAPTPAVPIANVAFEIAAQSLAGKNRFEIRLDPPELGRIDVRLEIDNDGHVRSRLIVERSETLDMLRRDAPQLERALQQAGLKTSDNALEFTLRDQAQQQRDDDNGNGRRIAVGDDSLPATDAIQQNYGRLLGLGSGLDIRV